MNPPIIGRQGFCGSRLAHFGYDSAQNSPKRIPKQSQEGPSLEPKTSHIRLSWRSDKKKIGTAWNSLGMFLCGGALASVSSSLGIPFSMEFNPRTRNTSLSSSLIKFCPEIAPRQQTGYLKKTSDPLIKTMRRIWCVRGGGGTLLTRGGGKSIKMV